MFKIITISVLIVKGFKVIEKKSSLRCPIQRGVAPLGIIFGPILKGTITPPKE